MKYTYTNTRQAGVRVFTKKGPLFINPGATITVDEPLSSAPYWIVPVNTEDPLVKGTVESTVTVTEETTVTATEETTVAKTTKARRRKTTTEKE